MNPPAKNPGIFRLPADLGQWLVLAGGVIHGAGAKMLQARNDELAGELEQTRAELEQTRAELEQTRAELADEFGADVDEHQGADVDEHQGADVDDRGAAELAL